MKERTKIIILDIAFPYDLYISETYKLKVEKYKSLQAFIVREIVPHMMRS